MNQRIMSGVTSDASHILRIGLFRILGPAVFAVDHLNKGLRDKFLQATKNDNIILTMEIDPAAVAFAAIAALQFSTML